MTDEINNFSLLVVEDEQPLLEAIRAKLEKRNFKVTTARTAEQAYSYVTDGVKVDAIWLDHYLLGSKDGLDLVSNLKSAGSNFRNIPIFVVSNTASPSKVQSYLRLGINKYFTKSNTKLEDIVNDLKKNIEK